MFDIRSIVFDEIALEGLDGITINSLWIRLQNRTDFQFNLEQQSSKDYVWKNVIIKFAKNNLKFYLLPQERPIIKLYNRYDHISPDTGYCISNEEQIPDDVYADVCPINENGERGSCKYYKERQLISLEQLNELNNLNQVHRTYGDKLIIVASQLLREISLRINYNDPQIEMSPIQYCIIERVGRCRRLGEVTFGKESANFKDPPKTLFYFRKLLLKKGLITKQIHTIYNTKTLSITRGLLLMLPRFHIDRKSPIELAAHKISKTLKSMPNQQCEYIQLKNKVNIRAKPFKHVFSEFTKNFRVYEKEIEATGKNNKRIKTRFVELIKNLDEDDDIESLADDTDDLNDDNEKQLINGKSKVKLFSPENILVNRTLMSQSYNIVESYSILNGCSLREFQNELILPRLDARMLIRMLERLNEVTTITTNMGRQKIIRYFLKNQVNQAVTSFNNENNQLDLGKKSTLVQLKRANIILNAVKQHKIIDQLVYFKKLILEAEKNLPYAVDQKSIKTIVATLAQGGYITWIQRSLEKNNQIKELNLVCVPSIKEDDEIVNERIEQAKFKFFSNNNLDPNTITVTTTTTDNNENSPMNCKDFANGNEDIDLVYQPSAGRRYGLEPKMKKIITFYKFLFFTLSDDCKRDNNYNDWRQHITPLPKSYEKDTCLLGDLIPRMPLSIFTKVVFITFIIPGLDELLNDPLRCNYTLQMLPSDIVRNLFRKRKYLFSMVELLTSLTYLNLVELINKQTQLKESVSIKLLKTTQFVEDDCIKNYRLENLDDVEMFANDLALHSSKVDCKTCSFDSRLYIHNPRNWSYLPKINRNTSEQMKGIRRFERLRNVIDKNDDDGFNSQKINSTSSLKTISSSRSTTAAPASSSTTNKRKLTNNNNQNSSSKSNKRRKTTKENVAKNSRTNTEQQQQQPPLKKKKPRSNSYDKEDMNALSLLRKQRSEWSKEEDSFLLMCRVASILLHPTSVTFICVSRTIIRDQLHAYLPQLSLDKTSKACQRRIMYMLKNPRTRAHVLDWVAECKQDPELSKIKKPNVPSTHEEEWNSSYIDMLNKLLKKFQNEHFVHPTNTLDKFRSLDDIYKRYNLIESEMHCVPAKPSLYYQPNNIVDIYLNVVLNIIASSLLGNLFDNTDEYNLKANLAQFKIYQRYPDTMIRSVVNKMKQYGMMAKQRDVDRAKGSKSKKNQMLCLFKISQHYCFVLKSRYSIDTLSMPIKFTSDFKIDNNYGATQIALLTGLMSTNCTQFNITIPENFIAYKESTKHSNAAAAVASSSPSIHKDVNNNNFVDDELSITELSSNHYPKSNESIIINGMPIDQATWTTLNKRASRYILCSVRQKMDLATKLNQANDIYREDFLVLSKCNVVCRISSIDHLTDLADFLDLIKKQDVFVDVNADYLNEIDLTNLERQIVKEVMKTKELGLNFKQLEDTMIDQIDRSNLKSTIRKLCDQQVLFLVGVEELRLVTHKFVLPWLVNVQVPLSRTTNNDHLNEIESTMIVDQDKNNNNKNQNNIVQSSSSINEEATKSKIIYYQPKFWKNPFGQLDRRVIVLFLSGVLGHIMANPGITNDDLISYFKFCLPPVQTSEIIDLLVAAKCILRIEQEIICKFTLFGNSDKRSIVYYEPTKHAFLTICAIKNLFDN